MDRNYKFIFNGILSLLILINILILVIIAIDYALNLKPSNLGMIKFDILVSFLIIISSVYRYTTDKNKSQYLARNWTDILAIIPLSYLAILIIPNAYILIIILFFIRIWALFKYLRKLRDVRKLTRKTKLDYATFLLLITLIFGSIIFFLVESPVNPTVPSFDSSVFFLIVSMTTVGYGNTVPFTHIGQLIAIIAIIIGIGYTGWVTAAMASSLVQEIRKERDEQTDKENKTIEEIIEKLNKIENDLKEIKR